MNISARYYKHSGKFNLIGPVLIIFLGGIITPVLSFIYAFAIHHIPYIFINVFLTFGLGALVGATALIGAKIGKIRSMPLVCLFGLLFGLLAEYTGWVSWIYILSEHQQLLLHPLDILAVMRPLAESGVWTLFGWTPTGIALYAVWLIEGVMIVGFSGLMAYAGLKDLPFCERCGVWTLRQHTSHPLEPISNVDKLVAQLELNDFSPLTFLKKADPAGSAYTQLELNQCPDCQRDGYLTLKSVTVEMDSKGKSNKKQSAIFENMILNNESYSMVKAIG